MKINQCEEIGIVDALLSQHFAGQTKTTLGEQGARYLLSDAVLDSNGYPLPLTTIVENVRLYERKPLYFESAAREHLAEDLSFPIASLLG